MLTMYGIHRSRASRNIWLVTRSDSRFRHVPVIQAYRSADAAQIRTRPGHR